MEIIMSVTIGVLYTAGIYMLLRRSILKLIIGIILMGHATNLLIFVSGSLTEGKLPFAEKVTSGVAPADPLPQALVLTALVIGLGISAFSFALIYRFYTETGTEDLDEITEN